MQLYVVTSAVLVQVEERSKWKVTFEPKGEDPGGGQAEQALVSPDRIDYLFFDASYTLDQIEHLEDNT